MSNYEEDESVPKGNEWEVVVLTDSTYAASPGPNEGISDSSFVGVENLATVPAVFMSDRFGSPSKQENMPREGDLTVPQPIIEQSGKLGSKREEDLNMEGLVSDGFPGEKGDKISFTSSDFGNVMSSKLTDKEQSMYDTGRSGSFHDEANTLMDENARITEELNLWTCQLLLGFQMCRSIIMKVNLKIYPMKPGGESMLRRHMLMPRMLIQFGTSLWLPPLWIVGYRWQRDKHQVMQIKPRLAIDDDGSRWILDPVTRFNNVALSGQNSPHIRVFSATEH